MILTRKTRSLARLACITLVLFHCARDATARATSVTSGTSITSPTASLTTSIPSLEGPDPQFKNAFTKAMAKKDKAEMAKLVKSQVPDAVDWIIYTGEQISDQGRPTYNIEYRIAPRWTITGEYDRFADYNIGFKWLIYSR